MNTNYQRVIPRDFFNEAKLLKCMGVISLSILDSKAPCVMNIEESGEPFSIGLMDCGHLTVGNYELTIKETPVILKSTYNSKSNYPLLVEYDYCDYTVFDENGEFTDEFIDFCESID